MCYLGSTRVIQEVEETGEKCGQEPSLWFPREGASKSGKAVLGLTNLNNFSGLSVLLNCLIPGHSRAWAIVIKAWTIVASYKEHDKGSGCRYAF